MNASDAAGLSIVVTSRNDHHGGDLLRRMRIFLQGLLDQTRRHQLAAELIVVEWNPPADRPPLREVLPRPGAHDCLTLRYLVVPGEIHRRYRRSADLPLFQMIAKNVGIRRARGAFVLCTNVDLLFSDPLVQRLARGALRSDTYYRANRCDVPDAIDPDWDISRQLAWCERHTLRRLGRDPRYRALNLELIGLQDKPPYKKWIFDKLAFVHSRFWPPEKRRFFQLDLSACGDFTLMSREAWIATEGHVELDLYSLHVDSLSLVAAASLRYAQHVFPPDACTYHIDHPAGWQALTPLEKVRFLERRPALDYSLLQEVGLSALKHRRPLGLNPPDWGYAGHAFEEFVFTPGGAPAPERAPEGALTSR